MEEGGKVVLWAEANRATIHKRLNLSQIEVIRERVDVSDVFDLVALVHEQQGELKKAPQPRCTQGYIQLRGVSCSHDR
jgi:hypothetical protein